MLHQNMRRALRVVAQDLEPETNQPRKAPTIALRTRFEAAQALDALGWLPDDLYQFVCVPAGEDIPEFWMGRYLVTNAQYGRFLTSEEFLDPALWHDFPNYDENSQPIKETTGDAAWKWLMEAGDGVPKVIAPRYWGDPRFGSSRPGAPVVGVSWWEANAYCRWLERHWGEREEGAANAGMAGVAVRLPTEKEWLKAAGGDENGRYPWDEPGTATNLNDEDAIMARANVYESGLGSTTPVGMFPRGRSHPYGLEDMAGNVLEWQANVYSDNSSVRALRGGSWDDGADFARCALRNRARPDGRGSGVGFRVAVSPSR
jgi:formylglycine-generating enzyme required for sulfatase activity